MSTPGVMNPTTIGQPAGNPRLSAIATREANNVSQNMANTAMAGGKHRRLRGGAGEIPVAQFSLPYKEQNGPGTGVNDQMVNNNKTNTQGIAFAVDDSLGASLKGGRRRHYRKRSSRSKIGGNPNWSWGCYSGGKTHRKHRNSRKHRKSRRKH